MLLQFLQMDYLYLSDKQYILLSLQTYSKKDIELLSKVQGTLAFMLNDENVAVQKRVMLCVTQLYKYALQVGGLLSVALDLKCVDIQ